MSSSRATLTAKNARRPAGGRRAGGLSRSAAQADKENSSGRDTYPFDDAEGSGASPCVDSKLELGEPRATAAGGGGGAWVAAGMSSGEVSSCLQQACPLVGSPVCSRHVLWWGLLFAAGMSSGGVSCLQQACPLVGSPVCSRHVLWWGLLLFVAGMSSGEVSCLQQACPLVWSPPVCSRHVLWWGLLFVAGMSSGGVSSCLQQACPLMGSPPVCSRHVLWWGLLLFAVCSDQLRRVCLSHS